MDPISRIYKLLALTDSPNKAEAALAAVKACELMKKHNVTIGDGQRKNGAINGHTPQFYPTAQRPPEPRMSADHVAIAAAFAFVITRPPGSLKQTIDVLKEVRKILSPMKPPSRKKTNWR
jgi:hypothetical protein